MSPALFLRACLLLAVILLPVSAGLAADPPPPPAAPIVVRAVTVSPGTVSYWRLSGVVRGRREVPLGFRVGGEIVERRVVAGQAVRAGEVLFRLDDRDLRRALESAEATLASARSEAIVAERESDRRLQLRRSGAVAAEAADRAEFQAVAAVERQRAAEAARAQAANALSYAVLKAPADGIIVEVTAEPHQVVQAGQQLALLTHSGGREAEVFVPEARRASLPAEGQAQLMGRSDPLPARLREMAATTDSASRSFRARYAIPSMADDTPIGTSLTLLFADAAPGQVRLPLTALADAGRGPFVWRIGAEGQVVAHPVRVNRILDEEALVETDLPAGTQVVAMGVNRIAAGAVVRVLP